jgi:MFS family permease
MHRPAAAALIGDIVASERRVTAYAMLRLANNLGFAAGPATAGFLIGRSFQLLFFADAATSIAYGLIAILALPRVQQIRTAQGQDRGALRDIVSNAPFLMLLLGALCITWIEYQVVTTLPLYVSQIGFSPATYGQLISLNGLLVAALELVLTKWTQRFRPQLMIALGFALFGGGFALIGAAKTIPMLALAVVVWTLGEMICMPVTGAYVTQLAPEPYRGRYQGLWHLTWSIGMLLGPTLGALAFASRPAIYWWVVAAGGVLGAALVLIPIERKAPLQAQGKSVNLESSGAAGNG